MLALRIAIAWLFASGALAQSAPDAAALLSEARTGLQSADFSAADLALDRAEQGTMSRDQLLEWLELRALVAYADQRLGALDETLRAYAALLAADAPQPLAFPAPIRTRLAELQAQHEPIRLAAEVGAHGAPRAISVVAQVLADPGHLVRRTAVRARVDDGPLREVMPGQMLPAPIDPHRDVRVGYVVEAFGPGGALLESLGSEVAPEESIVRGLPVDDTPILVGVTIAGVVVALGIVAIIIAAVATDGFSDGANTTIHGPIAALIAF